MYLSDEEKASPPAEKSRGKRCHLVPDAELEHLKRGVDLVALVRSYGVELKPSGKDFVGKCPFHDDKHASLVISPDKNLWHCMGACNVGGTTIDWVMRMERAGFRRAVEILRERVGGSTAAGCNTAAEGEKSAASADSAADAENTADASQSPANTAAKGKGKAGKTRLASPVEITADEQKLLAQVADYYHATLLKTTQPKDYLASRGIAGDEVIREFKIGFADRSLGMRLPAKRKNKDDLRTRLQQLGILRESGHEHMTGSVVFPITNESGQITGMYGRKICDRLRKGTPNHLYLPSPHKGFFNARCLLASREIIVCEAIIDALSFWVHGLKNVTAAFGTNGFTDEMLQAFVNHNVSKVYIAFDADPAGDKAAPELVERLGKHGIASYRIQFPQGMDANDFICDKDFKPEMLQNLVDKAVAMNSHIFQPSPAEQPAEPIIAAKEKNLVEPSPSQAEFSSLAATIFRPAEQPAAVEPSPVQPQFSSSAAPSSATKSTLPVRRVGEDWELVIDDRSYRVRGLAKNLAYDTLRVNLRVMRGDKCHLDIFDLYQARQRAGFIHQASQELGIAEEILKYDIGKILLTLEELQDKEIQKTLKPEQPTVPPMTERERDEAMAFLRRPDLVEQIVRDFHTCGLVGEDTNCLVGYLANTSRKLDDPLALIIQALSSAGKSAFQEALLRFMPPEDVVRYAAMTGQALFYMGETDLKHKILAISEQEGAERATYALKIMQSEKCLKIASVGKDPKSGKMVTHNYSNEGPVQPVFSTTREEIDEELLNRSILLTSNITREQTQEIHRLQREKETLDGMVQARERERIVRLHQNAQRMLRPILVINPYAPHLTFLDSKLRTRRDHTKYLTLIRTIALLHQYQRSPRHETRNGQVYEYIEVTLDDIALANRLAGDVMGISLDELAPQTRKFLSLILEMVKKQGVKDEQGNVQFGQREIRDYTGWGHTQVKIHLQRLVDMEYLLVRKAGIGQRYSYELMYKGEGENGSKFLLGLVDIEALRRGNHNGTQHHYRSAQNGQWSGQKANWSGPGRGQVGAESAQGRSEKLACKPANPGIPADSLEKREKRI